MNQDIIEETLKLHGYTIGKFLGAGGFARCYEVIRSQGMYQFACKIMSMSSCKTKELKDKVEATYTHEIMALQNIYHQNIIKVYDFFEENEMLFLILEYCPKGTVTKEISESGKLNKEQLIKYTYQLIKALEFLHSMKFAHHDIKPDNCLIDTNGNLVLTDFGFASPYDTPESMSKSGTASFCAPEIRTHSKYDPFKADIWSLGVTLYYFFMGQLPFDCKKNLQQLLDIQRSFYLGRNSKSSRTCSIMIRLINMCLKYNPLERATPSQLLEFLNSSGKICNHVSYPQIPSGMILNKPILVKKKKNAAAKAFRGHVTQQIVTKKPRLSHIMVRKSLTNF